MSITFDVVGTMDFSQFSYLVVFNTSGNGQCPGTNTLQSNWAGWSFAIIAGPAGPFGTSAGPVQFIRSNVNQHIPPAFHPLGTTPALFQYNPNSNGSGSEFTVIFSRSIFTQAPVPSPAPSSSPVANTWLFNAFTATGTGGSMQFADSLGAGGPNPNGPQWPCGQNPLHTRQAFDNTYTALYTGAQINQSAQITTITIGNNP